MSLHLAYQLLDDKIGHDFYMPARDGLEAEVVMAAVGSRLRGHRASAPPAGRARGAARAAVADDAKDQKLKVQVADDAWAVDAVVLPGSFLPNPRLLLEPALIIGPKLTFA